MKYMMATMEHVDEIYQLINNTIKIVYPKYYPQEVVDFFCDLHNKEHIEKDIASGKVLMFLEAGRVVGTGSYDENHITRVYVDPCFQNQGYGSYIMQTLEDNIALKYKSVYLDASLPACCLYEKRGYIKQKHEKLKVENDVILVYEVMEKKVAIQMEVSDLLDHLNELHTTELGAERIQRNLKIERNDVVEWCKNKITSPDARITRNGKNWYISIDGCIITVNAYSYTIITAHVERGRTLS